MVVIAGRRRVLFIVVVCLNSSPVQCRCDAIFDYPYGSDMEKIFEKRRFQFPKSEKSETKKNAII